MEKKYRTEPEGDMLRIIALKDFSDVKKGDFGGLIAAERNLSQEGDCWIYNNARVSGNAYVRGFAKILGGAKVYGNAVISENARVSDSAEVYGNARVRDNAHIYGDAKVCGNCWVCGSTRIYRDVKISGTVKLWCWSCTSITTSIENNKDYIILGNNRGEFHIYSSKIENITNITSTARDYIKNIQTIRQIYLTSNF